MISPNKYVIRRENILWRVYDGEAVLMDDDGTHIHTLNSVASYIWELANGEITIGEISDKLYERFEIERDIAGADTIEFIQQLIDKDLVLIRESKK